MRLSFRFGGLLLAYASIAFSATVIVVCWISTVELMRELNMFYDEVVGELDEFKTIAGDAWKGVMQLQVVDYRFKREIVESDTGDSAESSTTENPSQSTISGSTTSDNSSESVTSEEPPIQNATKTSFPRVQQKKCDCPPVANNCPRGPAGPDGARGVDGVPGQPGKDGKRGEIGISLNAPKKKTLCNDCGEGPPGVPGAPGPPGRPGKLGKRGANGRNGKDGDPGETGIIGEIGRQGHPGPRGKVGEKGKNGERGTGKRGPRGEIGNRGLPGEPGAPGTSYFPGLLGPAGAPGTEGPPGVPGIPGGPGVPGAQGAPGAKGAPGGSGETCPCPKGAYQAAPAQIYRPSPPPVEAITLASSSYANSGDRVTTGSSYVSPSYTEPQEIADVDYVKRLFERLVRSRKRKTTRT